MFMVTIQMIYKIWQKIKFNIPYLFKYKLHVCVSHTSIFDLIKWYKIFEQHLFIKIIYGSSVHAHVCTHMKVQSTDHITHAQHQCTCACTHTHEGAKRHLDNTRTVTVYIRMSHFMYKWPWLFGWIFSTKNASYTRIKMVYVVRHSGS